MQSEAGRGGIITWGEQLPLHSECSVLQGELQNGLEFEGRDYRDSHLPLYSQVTMDSLLISLYTSEL